MNRLTTNNKMKRFFVERWFLIVLVTALVSGILFASQLRPLVELPAFRNVLVAVIMFVMAWPLRADAVYRSLRRPGPPLLAVAVNLGLLPLFAWMVSPILSADMGTGLLVAATTPCTLASATVWTQRAGGNGAVSILVTIMTNSICFIVTPLWLLAMTGKSVESPELSLSRMSIKLGLLVVLPMVIAQLTRVYGPIADWATHRRVPLGVVAQCGVLAMVLVGAIGTGLRLQDGSSRVELATDLPWMLVSVIVVHVVMLYTGVALARLCGFAREDQIAVAFAGSQKTLMVGLLVAISLQVSILPMVAYHVSQLFVDTLIADRFRKTAHPDRTGEEGTVEAR
jgi:sodium/bile acid cotransporter 7